MDSQSSHLRLYTAVDNFGKLSSLCLAKPHPVSAEVRAFISYEVQKRTRETLNDLNSSLPATTEIGLIELAQTRGVEYVGYGTLGLLDLNPMEDTSLTPPTFISAGQGIHGYAAGIWKRPEPQHDAQLPPKTSPKDPMPENGGSEVRAVLQSKPRQLRTDRSLHVDYWEVDQYRIDTGTPYVHCAHKAVSNSPEYAWQASQQSKISCEAIDNADKWETATFNSYTKLICVSTSLSSGEWNHYASGTNCKGKKQHFVHEDGAPTLIICDPRVAATTARDLWLASGMRAVDHFVETMCSPKPTHEATPYVTPALENLLKDLVDYRDSQSDGQPTGELLKGISDCQRGSRLALFAWIFVRVAFGTSHALEHQLGSYARVQHGITSCIFPPPVLAYTQTHSDVKIREGSHAEILSIFNETFNWSEKSASDAVARLTRILGLPSRLLQVGVTANEHIQRIVKLATTYILREYDILPPLGGIKTILDTVR
ncbi:hypothetical protein PISL3812_09486 [Talaromyces islandicus]|uniref:Fe-containing alcohol dehydrogenase-like C-terminal domain-containing protein n=1 Tax=Talaromyces islandicus TaxID=28573 RepID=A0A0U1M9Y7_TALIS|nr:hypothetical protein PISL3812_09486 [Talaromyces islandicus]